MCWRVTLRQILDAIERNGYNNFTKRAYVPKWRKYASLPLAFTRANFPMAFDQRLRTRPALSCCHPPSNRHAEGSVGTRNPPGPPPRPVGAGVTLAHEASPAAAAASEIDAAAESTDGEPLGLCWREVGPDLFCQPSGDAWPLHSAR
jgi:hypothetical protein